MKAKNAQQEKYFSNQKKENEKQKILIENLKTIIENKDYDAKKIAHTYERKVYTISE